MIPPLILSCPRLSLFTPPTPCSLPFSKGLYSLVKISIFPGIRSKQHPQTLVTLLTLMKTCMRKHTLNVGHLWKSVCDISLQDDRRWKQCSRDIQPLQLRAKSSAPACLHNKRVIQIKSRLIDCDLGRIIITSVTEDADVQPF